jgi:hypothetical protein
MIIMMIVIIIRLECKRKTVWEDQQEGEGKRESVGGKLDKIILLIYI